MKKKINVLKEAYASKICLMLSIIFVLYSPSKYSTENDFRACVNEVTADEHDCESRCDTISYNRGFFSRWFGGYDNNSPNNIAIDSDGRNACYMNCQNRKVSEITVRCQHLIQKPAPAIQPVEAEKPRAPIPNLDKLITWPDSVGDLNDEDKDDIPVPPKKEKKSRSKPKTIEEISTIDQRND